MSSRLAVTSLSFAFAATALAMPVRNASPASKDIQGGLYPLVRRGFNAAPSTTGDDYVFDPSYAQAEIKRILAKYKDAANIIHNTQLPTDLQDLLGNPQLVTDYVPPDLQAAYDGNGIQSISASRQATMRLTDYISGNLDILYYGPVGIGSRNQQMTVDIDTGSADLWVPVDCQDCPHQGYQADKSSSYRQTGESFSVQYGTGDVSGVLAQDRVSVGSLVVENQYFGAVDQESDDFKDSPNDGLIGMAFSSIASSNQPTFFENLIKTGKVGAPIFSLHLTRHKTAGSTLCLGCYDSSKTAGPVTWIPVASKTYWAVSMPGARVNGNAVTMSSDITAAIDSGTTLIYVPQSVATAIYRQIPGARQADRQYGPGFWTFPCSSKLNIQFKFGGSFFALNPVDFNLGRTGSSSSTCVGGILGMGGGFPADLAIVGDEFLKSWYSVYDYSHGARVGFAPSVNNHS